MRFGTFHLLTHPPGLTAQELLQQTLDEAVLAEELGFDTCWLTEHHGSRYGLSSSPAVLAAAIAARTQRIGLGFAAHITPMHHPVSLAEQVAMVDQLSGGRVIAGFGAGYSPYEFSMVGADFETRHGTHWEIVDLVRQLWTQPQVTHRSELFDLEGVASFPKPLQQPHPPIAVTAGHPDSVRSVAERGHRILLLGGDEQVRDSLVLYRETLEIAVAAGNITQEQAEDCAKSPGVMRQIYIADDAEAARDAVRASTAWSMGVAKALAGMGPVPLEESDFHSLDLPAVDPKEVEGVLERRVLAGDAAYVTERLSRLQEIGVGEVLCWMRWGFLSHQQAMDSMQCLAKKVLPAFKYLRD
jgi:alkanesulfonate monooxygenase SsuD/methylene tetrahydromethanopterin reductase-like flavin-dependent oxidoreductase (luciferase family)